MAPTTGRGTRPAAVGVGGPGRSERMARIAGPSRRGFGVRLMSWFTRRAFAKITGRRPVEVLEPLELYAHLPGVLRAYGKLEQATAKLHRLDWRLQVLADLRERHLFPCGCCSGRRSHIARHA